MNKDGTVDNDSIHNAVVARYNESLPHLVLHVDAMVDDGEEPGGPLQGVGAAGLQVQGAEAPELQLAQEVPGTHSLRQVQLALQHNISFLIWTASLIHNIHLAVQAQDVLEYSGGPVKVELPPLQRVRVAQAEYLSCNKHITSHHGHWDMRTVALPLL